MICIYQHALLSVLSPSEILVKHSEFYKFSKYLPVQSPFRSPPKCTYNHTNSMNCEIPFLIVPRSFQVKMRAKPLEFHQF